MNYDCTVIITTRNRKRLLEKAVLSVINQTYKNILIQVYDNCSSDGTNELMNSYIKKYKNIRYFRHNENIGLIGNISFAYEQLTTKYYCVLCDDDYIHERYIEKCIDFLKKNETQYVFVSGTTILLSENYTVIRKNKTISLDSDSVYERFYNYLVDLTHDIVTGVFLTSSLLKIKAKNGYFVTNNYSEDVVLMLRFLMQGKGMVLNDTFYYKLNNGKTRVLEETPSDYFSIKGINSKNFMKCIYSIYFKALKKEPYFRFYIRNNKYSLKKFSKTMKAALNIKQHHYIKSFILCANSIYHKIKSFVKRIPYANFIYHKIKSFVKRIPYANFMYHKIKNFIKRISLC